MQRQVRCLRTRRDPDVLFDTRQTKHMRFTGAGLIQASVTVTEIMMPFQHMNLMYVHVNIVLNSSARCKGCTKINTYITIYLRSMTRRASVYITIVQLTASHSVVLVQMKVQKGLKMHAFSVRVPYGPMHSRTDVKFLCKVRNE